MCEPLQYSTKGFVWVCSSGGEDVKGAITVEATESETMYVGRASHEDDLVPGKVHKSHNVLYVPWGMYKNLPLHKNLFFRSLIYSILGQLGMVQKVIFAPFLSGLINFKD